MVNQVQKLMIVLLVSSLIGACSHGARKDPIGISKRVDTDIEQAETDRQVKDRYTQKKVARASRPTKIIKIPRSAMWLRDRIDVSYQGLPAKLAIAEVLEGRPFRFDLLGSDSVQQLSGPQMTTVMQLPDGSIAENRAAPSTSREPDPREMPVSPPIEANTIKDHLDAISSLTGLNYEIENGVVVFANYTIATFPIKANSMKEQQEFKFANNFNGSSNNSSGNNNNNNEEDETIYSEIDQALSKMIRSPNEYSVSRYANSVTIKAKRAELRQAQNYIEQLNYIVGRRVKIRLDIHDIDLTALGSRRLDFALENLLSDIEGLEGLNTSFFVNSLSAAEVATSGADRAIRFNVDSPDQTLNGAQGLIQLLRGKGAVTTRASREIILGNNEEYEEVKAQSEPFQESVSFTQTQLGENTSTLTPTSQIQYAPTGTALQIHPTITESRVYLRLAIEDSVVLGFKTFELGDPANGGIRNEAPRTSLDLVRLSSAVVDGETVALLGDVRSFRSHSTENNSVLPILGDNVDKNERRTQTLYFVTVNILD